MPRKIAQITAATTEIEGNKFETLFAICDDGSLWAIMDWCSERRAKWEKMPAIPESVPNRKHSKQMSFDFERAI